MDFVTGSDIALRVAWWTGAASVALVLLLMLEIVFLRVLLVYRGRRIARLHARWEPVLVESLQTIPSTLPPSPSPVDVFEFLLLWNYLRESLRPGEAGDKLVTVARHLGIHDRARKMLDSRSLRTRLLAIQTLGYMRDQGDWARLLSLSKIADPVVSLCAGRALMRIDTEKALPVLLPEAARRDDWSLAVIGAMLKEAGADAISAPLADVILDTPQEDLPRILRFLELAHAQSVAPSIRKLLAETHDLETITACLRILQDPEDLPTARKFLKDEAWQIRLQAAVCLGRIGTPDDVARLTHACGDLEWWVRYRAAQSLANLPFFTQAKLSQIAEEHQNEFGRDVLRQVIAEREVTGNV